MRPIDHTRSMAVLHRIEMDVIRVAGEIAFVPHRVLPIAPLPNTALAFRGAAFGDLLA